MGAYSMEVYPKVGSFLSTLYVCKYFSPFLFCSVYGYLRVPHSLLPARIWLKKCQGPNKQGVRLVSRITWVTSTTVLLMENLGLQAQDTSDGCCCRLEQH